MVTNFQKNIYFLIYIKKKIRETCLITFRTQCLYFVKQKMCKMYKLFLPILQLPTRFSQAQSLNISCFLSQYINKEKSVYLMLQGAIIYRFQVKKPRQHIKGAPSVESQRARSSAWLPLGNRIPSYTIHRFPRIILDQSLSSLYSLYKVYRYLRVEP